MLSHPPSSVYRSKEVFIMVLIMGIFIEIKLQCVIVKETLISINFP